MLNPLVSVIIVNWNGEKFLRDCLESLKRDSYKNKEIIIVDNGSSDGSVSSVRKNFPDVKIVLNSENLGFAGGNNAGFINSRGNLILLLNNDTIIPQNLLKILVSVISSEKNIGEVTPQILMYPKKQLIDSIGSFFVSSGILYHFGWGKNKNLSTYNKKMSVFSAKAACVLLRRDVLEKTGLFDQDYFSYLEDTDLSQRIWLSGNKVIYTPDTYVYHKGAGTAKKLTWDFVQFHSFKNRILTYLKNLSFKNLLIVLPQLLIIYEITFLLFLVTGKIKTAFSIQSAIFWNVFHIRETLRKRSYVQNKIRKIKDEDFLPKVTRSVRPSYYYYMFKGLGGYRD